MAYYLLAGQWRQGVVGGIENLSNAYIITGDPNYARKAMIMLDRVADLWRDFDFKTQGYMFGRLYGSNGYVGYWADSNWDTRRLILAYDKVKDAVNDPELVKFLQAKSDKYKISNRICRKRFRCGRHFAVY
jgi:hypothetical protein